MVQIASAADVIAAVAAAQHVCGHHESDDGCARAVARRILHRSRYAASPLLDHLERPVSIRGFSATRPPGATGLDTRLRRYSTTWSNRSRYAASPLLDHLERPVSIRGF